MSEDGKCIHELPFAQCGMCRPRRSPPPAAARGRTGFGAPAAASRPRRGPWITAGFDSECDGCGDLIEEGDQIRADGEGGWVCVVCGES